MGLLLGRSSGPRWRPRVLGAVYRGSAPQVRHALLLEPVRAWHLGEPAEWAEVLLSTAHQVCTFLEAHLWLNRSGKGPRSVGVLREPGALLDA